MLIAKTVLSVMLACSLFTPQSASDRHPPDLTISDYSWSDSPDFVSTSRVDAQWSGRDEDDFPSPSEIRPNRSISRLNPRYPSRHRFSRYDASLTVNNSGAKTVTDITVEYAFFTDASMSEMLWSKSLHSRKDILPGRSRRLVFRGAGTRRTSPHRSVRVIRVVYSDGSVWESPQQ